MHYSSFKHSCSEIHVIKFMLILHYTVPTNQLEIWSSDNQPKHNDERGQLEKHDNGLYTCIPPTHYTDTNA